jgi:predicted RNase H-like HicB family nuclease
MEQFKILIEKHPDGYVAYPIGIVGAIVGQGDTYEAALADVKSAIACHTEVFGKETRQDTPTIDQSDTWTDQDQVDVVNFSWQYAALLYND